MKKILLAAGIFGVIAIALVFSGCCGAMAKINSVQVTGYNVNIIYSGVTSGYFGPSSQALSGNPLTLNGGQKFTYTITMANSALLLNHNVNSISITTPGFQLLTVSPTLPYPLSPGSSVTLTMTIQAPNDEYTGPINFALYTN